MILVHARSLCVSKSFTGSSGYGWGSFWSNPPPNSKLGELATEHTLNVPMWRLLSQCKPHPLDQILSLNQGLLTLVSYILLAILSSCPAFCPPACRGDVLSQAAAGTGFWCQVAASTKVPKRELQKLSIANSSGVRVFYQRSVKSVLASSAPNKHLASMPTSSPRESL